MRIKQGVVVLVLLLVGFVVYEYKLQHQKHGWIYTTPETTIINLGTARYVIGAYDGNARAVLQSGWPYLWKQQRATCTSREWHVYSQGRLLCPIPSLVVAELDNMRILVWDTESTSVDTLKTLPINLSSDFWVVRDGNILLESPVPKRGIIDSNGRPNSVLSQHAADNHIPYYRNTSGLLIQQDAVYH